MPETCETCKYYESFDGREGKCRRYPPTVLFTNLGFDHISPAVDNTKWCGEYKPKICPICSLCNGSKEVRRVERSPGGHPHTEVSPCPLCRTKGV